MYTQHMCERTIFDQSRQARRMQKSVNSCSGPTHEWACHTDHREQDMHLDVQGP